MKLEYIITCPACGKETKLMLDPADVEKLKNGKGHVQDIFPDMDASDRELLISGLCYDCQDTIF